MCLGLLGEVVGIEDRDGVPTALVDVDGVRHEACLAVLPEAVVGDHVLVHLGFAVTLVPPEQAAELRADLAAIAELRASDGEPGEPEPLRGPGGHPGRHDAPAP
jgi:hydrogenase expression/formation protein HypC